MLWQISNIIFNIDNPYVCLASWSCKIFSIVSFVIIIFNFAQEKSQKGLMKKEGSQSSERPLAAPVTTDKYKEWVLSRPQSMKRIHKVGARCHHGWMTELHLSCHRLQFPNVTFIAVCGRPCINLIEISAFGASTTFLPYLPQYLSISLDFRLILHDWNAAHFQNKKWLLFTFGIKVGLKWLFLPRSQEQGCILTRESL